MKRFIDARKRHYAAYVDGMRELGLPPVTEQAFWQQPRGGASTEDLLGDVRGPDRERFTKRRREGADVPSHVRLEALIPGARATLSALRTSYELVLETLREDRERLLDEIDELLLSKFFAAIYSSDGRRTSESRAQLIQLFRGGNGEDAGIIIDSEADL